MEKSKRFYIFDGKFFSDTKKISTNNRAFRYGDGFFETIKIINGKIAFWENHFNRIIASSKLLNYQIPKDFKFLLFTNIKELLSKNSIEKGGRLRLHIFRRDGGLYTPNTNKVSYLIEVESADNSYKLNASGLKLGLYDKLFKADNVLSNYKLSGATIYVLAASFCKTSKFDEVILLNNNKRIAEVSSSNIFAINGSEILTPSLTELALDGTMRTTFLSDEFRELVLDKLSIEIYESKLKPEDLKQCDEVFITNAISGIKWISEFQQVKFKNNKIKEISKLLNNYVINQLN